ncbi:protein-L-isoaspartate O-methyltransferase family protein [Streptomyces fradiae]|uniref:protein-L-isoaspartate O-methyltransferase family protein n=1 Tax=Streptomyces fradiae TaxID=1906 RepID=UPI003700AAE6
MTVGGPARGRTGSAPVDTDLGPGLVGTPPADAGPVPGRIGTPRGGAGPASGRASTAPADAVPAPGRPGAAAPLGTRPPAGHGGPAPVDALLAALAGHLGRPLPARYEAAVRAVPRHLFLPDRLWLRDGAGGYAPCDRATDPGGWMRAAYADTTLVTRFTDGLPSSAASMPSMVLRTLLLADPAPHHRILELGTGTGFNAALLAVLAGDGRVTSVELHPGLAGRAVAGLRAAGRDPLVVTADAAGGWAPGSPYDRIVATFSVDRVPPAWLRQAREGGRIVTPWTSSWCSYGTLGLDVRPGGAALGRFHAFASFMPMRTPGGGSAHPAGERPAALPDSTGGTAMTRLSPWSVAGGDLDAEFHIGLSVPGASFAWDTSGEYAHTRLLVREADGPSWAAVDHDGRDAARFAVTQAGPRALWDEVAAAYRLWDGLGRPAVGRYRLTADADGTQTVWITVEGSRAVPVRTLPAAL